MIGRREFITLLDGPACALVAPPGRFSVFIVAWAMPLIIMSVGSSYARSATSPCLVNWISEQSRAGMSDEGLGIAGIGLEHLEAAVLRTAENRPDRFSACVGHADADRARRGALLDS